MIAEDGDVLTLDDILDAADRFGRYIPDSLYMLGNEHEVRRINVSLFDEAPGNGDGARLFQAAAAEVQRRMMAENRYLPSTSRLGGSLSKQRNDRHVTD